MYFKEKKVVFTLFFVILETSLSAYCVLPVLSVLSGFIVVVSSLPPVSVSSDSSVVSVSSVVLSVSSVVLSVSSVVLSVSSVVLSVSSVVLSVLTLNNTKTPELS
jgi:hypothetical protein